MIKPGELYEWTGKGGQLLLGQVVTTFNKRDIDPDCPESVAIVPMVRVMLWDDGEYAMTTDYRRGAFHRVFKKVEITSSVKIKTGNA